MNGQMYGMMDKQLSTFNGCTYFLANFITHSQKAQYESARVNLKYLTDFKIYGGKNALGFTVLYFKRQP